MRRGTRDRMMAGMDDDDDDDDDADDDDDDDDVFTFMMAL